MGNRGNTVYSLYASSKTTRAVNRNCRQVNIIVSNSQTRTKTKNIVDSFVNLS